MPDYPADQVEKRAKELFDLARRRNKFTRTWESISYAEREDWRTKAIADIKWTKGTRRTIGHQGKPIGRGYGRSYQKGKRD